jgi:hypothetical protein
MRRDWMGLLRRAARKPPRYVIERAVHEIRGQTERFVGPLRVRRLRTEQLWKGAGYRSLSEWWDALAERPYLVDVTAAVVGLDEVSPGESSRVLRSADRAMAHEVDMLGSGPIRLGARIDWHRDYKTGYRWPPAYFKDIDYANLDRPSDVKFPWELSRMQWMIPLGQAYAVAGNETYATCARDILLDWIGENPVGGSVNWSCTMDVALRILSWSWFFHAFKHSESWRDPAFRSAFLRALYLHADFTARNLERSDVNGNHFAADAAGLTFAGMFFGDVGRARYWLDTGWVILSGELPLQVFSDGVDHEASIAYHRLVQELFVLPVLYRKRQGLPVSASYCDRLVAMARFTEGYCRPDGSVPLVGDADDARALPFGGQGLGDHRYLLGLAAVELGADDLALSFSGPRSEVAWLCGSRAAAALSEHGSDLRARSVAFREGGFYVLRSERDHVFVDCGPVGMRGRGGHGHNDLLSFEVALDDVLLAVDCGAYVYTADFRERNNFRSTAYHNTPEVDGQEINRFRCPTDLWSLHDDARHDVRALAFGEGRDRLVVSHGGYRRLASPVTPVRTFELDHEKHRLRIHDDFEGHGSHSIVVRLHLAPGIRADVSKPGRVLLSNVDRRFLAEWSSTDDWALRVEPGRVSPSYGVVLDAAVLVWSRWGPLVPLDLRLAPAAALSVASGSLE